MQTKGLYGEEAADLIRHRIEGLRTAPGDEDDVQWAAKALGLACDATTCMGNLPAQQ